MLLAMSPCAGLGDCLLYQERPVAPIRLSCCPGSLALALGPAAGNDHQKQQEQPTSLATAFPPSHEYFYACKFFFVPREFSFFLPPTLIPSVPPLFHNTKHLASTLFLLQISSQLSRVEAFTFLHIFCFSISRHRPFRSFLVFAPRTLCHLPFTVFCGCDDRSSRVDFLDPATIWNHLFDYLLPSCVEYLEDPSTPLFPLSESLTALYFPRHLIQHAASFPRLETLSRAL